MEDELISFETAKLAKEKGLRCDLKEALYYNEQGEGILVWDIGEGYDTDAFNFRNQGTNSWAITQSLLQKWLREEYNTHIWISCTPYLNSYTFNYNLNKEIIIDSVKYSKHEEALEAGLQEALKLI